MNEVTKKILEKKGIKEFMPCQIKALDQGLLKGKSMLICSPTGSGKTLVAEIGIIESLMKNKYTNKAIYIVPLKALASEKYNNFMDEYSDYFNIAMLTGDTEADERDIMKISKADIIIMTSEKLDSILRHNHQWVQNVSVLVIDEIHLLDSLRRGPTLEIVITLMRELKSDVQIIGLSATIGNSVELAKWLKAELVFDEYRPVELKKGVIFDKKIDFVN